MQTKVSIAGYDNFEPLALGGMAVVYKARRTSIDRPVAIKVLYPHLASDASYLSRFRREAKTAASLQHDNIVNVIDTGESAGQHYIVMEFCDGLTVEQLLRGADPLSPDVVLSVIHQVATGLEAAHRARLIHRDIKPANIMVTREGGVKIADFGLARQAGDMSRFTQDGKLMGTPAYMAPEQTRGEDASAVSDIFSLGVVAYEMFTGRRPFVGRHYAEVVTAIQGETPAPPSELIPELDDTVDALIAHMLEKSPANRIPSAEDVVSGVADLARHHGWARDRETVRAFIENLPASAFEPVARVEGRTDTGTDETSGHHTTDPWANVPADADWFVYLDGVDDARETEASFAIKLSMAIKVPLPRVRALLQSSPARLSGTMTRKKARKLCRLVEELGGRAHHEPASHVRAPAEAADRDAARTNEARGGERPAPPRPTAEENQHRRAAAAGPPTGEDAPKERPSPAKRRAGHTGDLQVCPACGWEEAADAKFCSVCRHSFGRTESLDLNALRARQEALESDESPVSESVDLMATVRDIPRNIRIALGAGVIILILLAVYGR